LQPGDQLHGRTQTWTIFRPVGQGSFATAYQARCLSTGLLAAVKTSVPGPGVESEIDALVKLGKEGGHQNIVSLLDVIRVDGLVHLVLEWIEGLELFEFLSAQPGGKLSEPLARAITEQLLDALSFAHSRGVLHRDLKLDNILVSSTGLVKLIDFNLAARLEKDSVYTDPVGSVRYAAPTILELAAAGLPYPGDDGWPDVYSAGVCSFALLTGFWPFFGESAEEALDSYLGHFAQGGFGREFGFPAEISEDAREFVRAALDSRFRYRACEMRGHRWFRPEIKGDAWMPSIGSPAETLYDFGEDLLPHYTETDGMEDLLPLYEASAPGLELEEMTDVEGDW
jgi:serine/threonine protein kinase